MSARLCFLNVQPHALLVGKPDGFATEGEFYRFAAQECGFTGVTMPAGFVDCARAVESGDYIAKFQANLAQYGLTDGLTRMESHVIGQCVCLHPSRIKRFGFFVDEKNYATMSVAQLEAAAAVQMKQIIDASAAFGFTELPSFCGGRGFAVAMAKWSAWPKYFPEWVFALLAIKWNPILEYAADRGVTVTFEIGHPENDILTGANFVTFWNMLSDKARLAAGINADASHFLNVGIDPMPHFRTAFDETKCKFTNHFKWGASIDHGDGNASVYGGWQPWSKASTSFYTFGTIGPESLAREFYTFNKQVSPEVWDVVYEGECVGIKNPKQAMKIGADNCRAAINDDPFIHLEGIVPDAKFSCTKKVSPRDRPVRIIAPEGNEIPMALWNGGPFDAFADSPVKAHKLLEMTEEEKEAARFILAAADYEGAANI